MENTVTPNQNQKLILLVEDDPFLSNILMMKLQKEGLNVIHAIDGDDALTKLNEGDYEMVLLDLILPKKNGFEVLEAMRKDSRFENTPVIIVSNLGQDSDMEKARSLGVIDYIVKERLSIDDLVAKVKSEIPQSTT
ncbi:MAG: response regulator [Candidatus Parcubacteria bacterium]|nr:response regulator [Candidatus Parcubacteria bacterium]